MSITDNNTKEATMAMSNVDLILALNSLEGQVSQMQSELSYAYGDAGEEDSDSVLLDEAMEMLNGAVGAIDGARMKVAAYEGLRQAYASV